MTPHATEFIQRIKDLLGGEEPKYVLKRERDSDRNRIEYPGFCAGAREWKRRRGTLAYSEGT